MKILKELPISRLRGDKIIVSRYVYEREVEDGLDLPDSYVESSQDVHKVEDLPKFQNKGKVIAIGDAVEDGIYSLGDVVHFQPNFYQLAIFDKSDISIVTDKANYVDNAEVILDATNGVDWIEENVTPTPG